MLYLRVTLLLPSGQYCAEVEPPQSDASEVSLGPYVSRQAMVRISRSSHPHLESPLIGQGVAGR